MGYGAVDLDFESVDYSKFETDNTVVIDRLLFNEKDATLKITFDTTGDNIKISKVEEI